MISIHALREEGDQQTALRWKSSEGFLSTPSARRATKCPCNDISYRCISIHALREEGDQFTSFCKLFV